MARWFQYQNKTEAPQFAEPVPPLDSWYETLSEPVRYKTAPKLTIALIASGLFATPVNIPTPIGYVAASSPVIFNKLIISQSRAEPVFPDQTVAFNTYWTPPLSEPIRVRSFLRAALQQFFTAPVVVPTAPLATSAISSQVIFKGRLIYQSATIDPYALTQPESVTEDRWHQPWSEPVRQKRGLAARLQQPLAWNTEFTGAEVVTVDKWFPQLSTPVRVRRLPTSEYPALTYQGPIEDRPIGAVPTYLEGPPSSLRLLQYQSVALPTPLVDYRWYQPLSEPVRSRRLPVAQQQVLAAPVVAAEVVYEDKWHLAWSEPVRQRSGLRADKQQFLAFHSNPIVSFGWYGWLSDPVRQRRLPAAQQQFYASGYASDSNTLLDGYAPWSEPVRTRYLRTAQQQTLAWPENASAEVIYEDKWHFPWSEPVRQKLGLNRSLQPFLAQSTLNPVVTFSYYSRLNEPVRLKSGIRPSQQQFLAFHTNPIVSFGYYNWLSEPVRLKRGLAARYQQPFTGTTVAEVIYEDKWHQAWSQPVRTRRLATAHQQPIARPVLDFVAPIPNTTVSSAVFFKKRIISQTLAWPVLVPPTGIETISNTSQVVFKRRIISQSETHPVFVPVPIAGYEFLYSTESLIVFEKTVIYDPVSEPIFFGVRPVSVTLAATEANSDTADISIILVGRAERAVVSIKEIPRDDAYASIEET